MTKSYVFKYSFNLQVKGEDKSIEEVPTHAVAVLPADGCTLLLGGGSSWVVHITPRGVDTYLVDGEITCLEQEEALVEAVGIQRLLMERGTIAPDPRIPAPLPEKGKLKIVK
jgi:hypothetical protein